jgi:putative transposase
MRMRRLKVPAEEGAAVYHCVTRTVNGEFLMDDRSKEVLRKQLHQAARFSGVELLTFCLLDNHFHVLVKVPQRPACLADRELVARYRALYPQPTKYQLAKAEVLESVLKAGGPEADKLRHEMIARMNDISEFMKTVKQRFTVWYNHAHGRYGTLWAERFKSVLLENTPRALETVAAYIDLNPVRAGLVDDPGNYRWCGYAEAMAGGESARQGLATAVFAMDHGLDQWRQVAARYRALLGAEGSTLRTHQTGKARMDRATAALLMESGGKLPLPEALRCRVRYFTDGRLLGSGAFVESWARRHLSRLRFRSPAQAKPLRGADWGGLTISHGLRHRVFG